MHKKFVPSYKRYEMILKNIIKSDKPVLDYSEIDYETKEFIILRHDVEFSVERAYKLAMIESKHNISSSYFFQLTNNTYNLLSNKNIELIKKIHNNDHQIGLHVNLKGLKNIEKIKEEIKFRINILRKILNIKIERFSFHRPYKELLKINLKIDSLINVYDKKYFTYKEKVKTDSNLEVKYISDSKHRWNYGVPDKDCFKNNNKIQILIHPYSWTLKGCNNFGNFKSLLKEKELILKESIDEECSHFGGIKNEL